MTNRIVKRAASAAIAAAMVGVMAACAPETPEPEPSYLTFASEEEAYAAAEEVYRAYTAVVDRRLAGDQNADPSAFLIGNALEDELNAQRDRGDTGRSFKGESRIGSVDPIKYSVAGGHIEVELQVCVDNSEVRIIDESGQDITPEERVDIGILSVNFVSDGSVLKIANSAYEGPGEC